MKRPYLVPAVWTAGLVPLGVILLRGATATLGANPIAEALNQFGLLALILLVACLACTPIKIVTGATWPIAIRKSLGLLCFGYATLHLLTYSVLDQGLDLRAIGADIAERSFILVGFLAWCLLVPLAITSSSDMLKRLGARNWKRLHRLVYACGILAVLHFVWRVKKDVTEPVVYGTLLATLLLVRVASALSSRRTRRQVS